jgi:hypothetical protein
MAVCRLLALSIAAPSSSVARSLSGHCPGLFCPWPPWVLFALNSSFSRPLGFYWRLRAAFLPLPSFCRCRRCLRLLGVVYRLLLQLFGFSLIFLFFSLFLELSFLPVFDHLLAFGQLTLLDRCGLCDLIPWPLCTLRFYGKAVVHYVSFCACRFLPCPIYMLDHPPHYLLGDGP